MSPPPTAAASDATPTRERLLAAARTVVAEDGLEGLTLRAIARRAGVSHGAPLRHFSSLAALLAAVAAEGFERLVAAIDATLADADAAARTRGTTLRATERLALAGQAYLDVAQSDHGVFSVTFRPERCDVTDPDYQRAGDRSFGQLVALVDAAQAEGWHPERPATQLAAVLWSSVHGQAELLIHGALPAVLPPDQLAGLHAAATDLYLDEPHPGAAGAGPTPKGPM